MFKLKPWSKPDSFTELNYWTRILFFDVSLFIGGISRYSRIYVICALMFGLVINIKFRIYPGKSVPSFIIYFIVEAVEYNDGYITRLRPFRQSIDRQIIDKLTAFANKAYKMMNVTVLWSGNDHDDNILHDELHSKLSSDRKLGAGIGLIAVMTFPIFSKVAKLITSDGVCGDGWDLFHDDNYDICYKYYDKLGDIDTVSTPCWKEMGSSLLTINTWAEQDYLNKLMIKYNISNSVWLNAGVKNKHIVWMDSSSGEFENWIDGHPINDSNYVKMVAEQGQLGKWKDVACDKTNAYICKRVVKWSGRSTGALDWERLDEALGDIAQLKVNQGILQSELAQLSQSQVPIGFIYVQLPGQVEPKTLWPQYTWSDVTATYAGQFFRAEGGDSIAFGQGIQSDNAPRLTEAKWDEVHGAISAVYPKPGQWSGWLDVGNWAINSQKISINLLMSDGEVRPRNQAVRLFKRIE
ncbi:unnamed protein product [Medioppia subpectinata]|uniref:C-type lectin domain-containing protein n=1 Tax=Medioppia subpectinata TaxID=1979941 RepID=A0A7R9PT39_9ACAR|nr:unnamed protein product [Medioppia subpectinata]CAG2100260.1 unnamed protein product [Medioppia subpectinata]